MKYKELNYSKLNTYSIKSRKSKVNVENFFKLNKDDFLENLPDILAGKDVKEIVAACVKAKKGNKKIALAMGAHVIKVGLSPLINELIKRGLIDLIALNGAGIIHDTEIAMHGETSEDVDSAIKEGNFGMSEETGTLINNAIISGYREKLGLGESIGAFIFNSNFKYKNYSIIKTAYEYNVPVTVHVAIGTDIIHMSPQCSGEAIGATSLRDFKIYCNVIKDLQHGVYFNIGSTVILPEVFLKAITLVRNLGYTVEKFVTVNLDFIRHYRPMTNVVLRPTSSGGKGYNLTGHHEIMLPLIFLNIMKNMEE
jgi:deoxyhypusine synthase